MKYVKSFCVILFIGLLLSACKKECMHQYQSQITQQASCVQEGVETFTCSLCQHSYTQPIPVSKHSYEPSKSEKEATCTQEGIQIFCCAVCDATESKPIEKLPHVLEEMTVLTEPNCTQEGQGLGDCTVCGALQVTEKIPTNDVHIFTNTVIREATCTDPGEGTNTCQLCQYSESCKYELKAHPFSTQNVLVKASCTKDGAVERICGDCGYTTKETVAATGHSWSGATCKSAGVCSVCGAKGSKAKHAYVVSEDQKPSGTFAGYRIKKCSTCEKKKSEYYTKSYTYDLDDIASKIASHAKSKGFKPVIKKLSNYSGKVAYGVSELDNGGGPNMLIKSAKVWITDTYKEMTEDGASLGDRELYIYVYYTASGSVGGGYFGVYMKPSF